MSHLRWNPLLGTWTIVAANRQARPNMPENWCPFCPGSGKVPELYDVYVYPNDFPALSPGPGDAGPILLPGSPYRTAQAYGFSEVLLYSPRHDARLYELTDEHMEKLVGLWCNRHGHYSLDNRVKYVYPFENRGAEVGVTMPHPHGQLYAYSYVPLKVETELQQARKYYAENDRNLFEDILLEESSGDRVLIEADHFLVFLPYFTDYPYGLFIVARDPVVYLTELSAAARAELGLLLKKVSGTFDTLFNRPFPYMMCMHQAPVNSPEWGNTQEYYRFHIEFYPPLRSSTAIKYYASSEMGAWAAANTMEVEHSIIQLREALAKFESA